MKGKQIFRVFSVMLLLTLVAGLYGECYANVPADAMVVVSNAAFAKKSATVGVNGADDYVYVKNASAGASYYMTSSKTSVCKVKMDNSYGAVRGKLTGVKKGTAKITLYEITGAIKTKIGVCKVTVSASKRAKKSITVNQYDTFAPELIKYKNGYASYAYTSKNSKIVSVKKDGTITAKKAGKTTIIIKEKLGKNTRTVGSVTIKVVAPTVTALNSTGKAADIAELGYQKSVVWTSLIQVKNCSTYDKGQVFTLKSKDSSIVSVEEITVGNSSKEYNLKGTAVGTTEIEVLETYKGITRTIGTVKVEVKEIPVESFVFNPIYVDTSSGNSAVTRTVYYDLEDDTLFMKYLFSVAPANTTDVIMYSTSNPAVATVTEDGVVSGVSKGTATITATCGKYSLSVQIIVDKFED
ncbi:Ig-like domain-containing protein [Anaeromicropila populeti]|uniref:Ig-like domain (Group 2) n=1 Tax=Anaeromicropila populeti TaxID=37658 RepID=A0A1I6JWC0_9FIRM|nr:Ig-like domain-containing protein [Anaeromicropila populeti]SFR83257.1 Ig-like domain (group 2) [Anaeromicropila populeti]